MTSAARERKMARLSQRIAKPVLEVGGPRAETRYLCCCANQVSRQIPQQRVVLDQPACQLRQLPVRPQGLSQHALRRRRLSTLRIPDHASRNRHAAQQTRSATANHAPCVSVSKPAGPWTPTTQSQDFRVLTIDSLLEVLRLIAAGFSIVVTGFADRAGSFMQSTRMGHPVTSVYGPLGKETPAASVLTCQVRYCVAGRILARSRLCPLPPAAPIASPAHWLSGLPDADCHSRANQEADDWS